MAYRVDIHPPALIDAEQAFLEMLRFAPRRADRWMQGLIEAIQSLEEMPMQCPLAPEAEFFQQELRQLIYGKRANASRILFTVQEDTVHVLHIRHAYQKPLASE